MKGKRPRCPSEGSGRDRSFHPSEDTGGPEDPSTGPTLGGGSRRGGKHPTTGPTFHSLLHVCLSLPVSSSDRLLSYTTLVFLPEYMGVSSVSVSDVCELLTFPLTQVLYQSDYSPSPSDPSLSRSMTKLEDLLSPTLGLGPTRRPQTSRTLYWDVDFRGINLQCRTMDFLTVVS